MGRSHNPRLIRRGPAVLTSVLYVAFSAVLTVVIYRLVVQGWMEGILPEVVVAGLAWALAAAIVVLAAVGVLGELRGAA